MKSQVAAIVSLFIFVSPVVAQSNNSNTGNPDRREGNERLEKQGDKTGNPDRREGNQRQDKCPVAQRGCNSAKISKEDNVCRVDPRKCADRGRLDRSQTTKQSKPAQPPTFNPPGEGAPRTTAGGSSRTEK